MSARPTELSSGFDDVNVNVNAPADADPGGTHSLDSRLAEAARYALVRRLAPALRHNMAGALQPVSMIAAMLERRLQSATPDMAQLGKNSRDIGTLSREAAATCLSLMGWVAPKEDDLVMLNAGVEEAIGLIATELSFKGFSISNETGDVAGQLPRSVLRNVFLGGLLALVDAATAPATLVITATASEGLVDGDLTLVLEAVPGTGEASQNNPHAYRAITWGDVQALAAADGVRMMQSGDRLSLCWTR